MPTKPAPNPHRIVWIDGEMTGLNPRVDHLLELAVIITDNDLNELARFSEVIHQFRPDLVKQLMEPVVMRMHSSSGLLEDLDSTTEETAVPRVEARIIDFLANHDALGAVCAGSNIPFDRAFLDRWMPALNREALHYRSIDVSTVKELARRRAPEVLATAPAKELKHRGLSDIRESIAELRHYLDAGLMTATPATTKGTNR